MRILDGTTCDFVCTAVVMVGEAIEVEGDL